MARSMGIVIPWLICVPKNCVSRSKRLLKPQPLPHQHCVLELRTSLTKAGDGAKCGAKFADTPHVIKIEVTSASEMRKETGKHPCWRAFPAQYQRLDARDSRLLVKCVVWGCDWAGPTNRSIEIRLPRFGNAMPTVP